MLQRMGFFVATVGLSCLGACGGDGGTGTDTGGNADPIPSTTLAGTVAGQPWSLVAAETSEFLSTGHEDYWVDLYNEAVPACQIGTLGSGPHVILQVPRQPGTYPLSWSFNATIVVPAEPYADNRVAARGRLVVDEITATNIRGGAYLDDEEGDILSGRFDARICTE